MSTRAPTTSAVDGEREVMASIDDDGSGERVIIADTTVDGAWISMPLEDAMALSDRC
ncbi:DUF7556 family protein [Halalkalicoccus salilacus]|uniref:DUF7556 family protein n=1 Tax=Halalkalicoccus salilacus TaxID=3117459 RepID=UPI00300E7C29